MRLIDADELLEATDSDITKCSYNKTISRFDVITCPTIYAVVIPSKVTNGDMIKAIFPNAPIDTELYTNYVMVKLDYHTQYDGGLMFDKDWWNAPYRVESEE